MFRVSIRYGIPLLIVVFTAVLAAYTIQKEWGAAEAVVRGERVSQMINLYPAAAGRYVLGIYPISFGTVGEGGRPQRVGVLLVQRHLLRQLTHAGARPRSNESHKKK